MLRWYPNRNHRKAKLRYEEQVKKCTQTPHLWRVRSVPVAVILPLFHKLSTSRSVVMFRRSTVSKLSARTSQKTQSVTSGIFIPSFVSFISVRTSQRTIHYKDQWCVRLNPKQCHFLYNFHQILNASKILRKSVLWEPDRRTGWRRQSLVLRTQCQVSPEFCRPNRSNWQSARLVTAKGMLRHTQWTVITCRPVN